MNASIFNQRKAKAMSKLNVDLDFVTFLVLTVSKAPSHPQARSVPAGAEPSRGVP